MAAGQSSDLDTLVGKSVELSASEENNEKECNDGKVVSNQDIILPIDRKVLPSLKLIVFVNDGNQTLTDSHTYEANQQQQPNFPPPQQQQNISQPR